MTTPEIEPETPKVEPATPDVAASPAASADAPSKEQKDERRRRLLLILLLLLLVCVCCVGFLFVRYMLKPQPLADMLLPTQVAGACYKPAYKFSIKNVSGPVAVAVSPDNQRIYVAEGQGDRLVKMFDRDGNLITSFAPPGTDKANREPKYMAVGLDGRVYLVDRTSNAIDIYDPDGNFIDAIIGQEMTLSKYLAGKVGPLPQGMSITHYEGVNKVISYQIGDVQGKKVTVEFPADEPTWSPLGLRFDPAGNLIYTDLTTDFHSVHIIPAVALADLTNFNPQIKQFGEQGSENAQLDFPQTVVEDGKGNYYISDGNNSRITVWSPDMKYKTFFGFGSNTGALNLPRGIWMGTRDCLYVADSVGAVVRVYDVSGVEPKFSFEIGGYGISEGQFNYPDDVIIDGTGRLYIADRENNRIQVWSQ